MIFYHFYYFVIIFYSSLPNPQSDAIHIKIYDHDLMTNDDLLGEYYLQVSSVMSQPQVDAWSNLTKNGKPYKGQIHLISKYTGEGACRAPAAAPVAPVPVAPPPMAAPAPAYGYPPAAPAYGAYPPPLPPAAPAYGYPPAAPAYGAYPPPPPPAAPAYGYPPAAPAYPAYPAAPAYAAYPAGGYY